MNLKKILATAALFAATGAVFANDLMPFAELDNFKSSQTRADVKAVVLRDTRLQAAAVHGDLNSADQPAVIVKNTRTRAEAIESAKNQAVAPTGKAGS